MHKLWILGGLLLSLACADIDLVADLGITHAELLQKKGIPNSILPIRQKIADEDDVVFVYTDSYFYLYNNHFYRAFFSKRYEGEIHKGLKIGSPRSAVTALWGNKYDIEKDGLVWYRDGYIVVAKIDKDNRLESLWLIMDAR